MRYKIHTFAISYKTNNRLQSSPKVKNMRVTALFFILLCCSISYTTAQNDYLVATSPSQEISSSKEELFIKENFPLQLLCKWAPGMKFMFVPSQRDMFLPTLSVYDTEKGTDNSSLKHKILTFAGTEEKFKNYQIAPAIPPDLSSSAKEESIIMR